MSNVFESVFQAGTYVVEALHDLGSGLAFQKAYQNQEHGLVQECAHGDALRLVSAL